MKWTLLAVILIFRSESIGFHRILETRRLVGFGGYNLRSVRKKSSTLSSPFFSIEERHNPRAVRLVKLDDETPTKEDFQESDVESGEESPNKVASFFTGLGKKLLQGLAVTAIFIGGFYLICFLLRDTFVSSEIK